MSAQTQQTTNACLATCASDCGKEVVRLVDHRFMPQGVHLGDPLEHEEASHFPLPRIARKAQNTCRFAMAYLPIQNGRWHAAGGLVTPMCFAVCFRATPCSEYFIFRVQGITSSASASAGGGPSDSRPGSSPVVCGQTGVHRGGHATGWAVASASCVGLSGVTRFRESIDRHASRRRGPSLVLSASATAKPSTPRLKGLRP